MYTLELKNIITKWRIYWVKIIRIDTNCKKKELTNEYISNEILQFEDQNRKSTKEK